MLHKSIKFKSNAYNFYAKYTHFMEIFCIFETSKPTKMKKVEVKNFKLYTTAVISIEWKQDLLNVNLDLAMMLKMMKMEGLTEADIIRYSQQGQPIPFKKVTLVLFQDDNKPGQYYTDESFDEDDDPTVFYVEIKESK